MGSRRSTKRSKQDHHWYEMGRCEQSRRRESFHPIEACSKGDQEALRDHRRTLRVRVLCSNATFGSAQVATLFLCYQHSGWHGWKGHATPNALLHVVRRCEESTLCVERDPRTLCGVTSRGQCPERKSWQTPQEYVWVPRRR